MGKRVGRVALFGIPLQQQWSYRVSGDDAPSYYLDTDADLYYYAFTDAFIAMAYQSLSKKQQARFDPMITGFNPADMYAADHIRRVLQTFPGVFSGIGEFTIHKEFVSSKIAGDVASLTDPALDRILDFAGEVGLVVILHNDIHMPFAKPDAARIYFDQMKALLRAPSRARPSSGRTPGSGASSSRSPGHVAMIEEILTRSGAPPRVLRHLVERGREVRRRLARVGRDHGRHARAPSRPRALRHRRGRAEGPGLVPQDLRSVRARSGRRSAPKTSAQLRLGNYERLFDQARKKVRAWEAANVR